MNILFKSEETMEDRIVVKADRDHVQLIGEDSEGDISKIFVSESDAIAFANAILKHFKVNAR